VAEFRARMQEHGLEELAYATDPSAGAVNAGYTYAMLIDTGGDSDGALRWVLDTMEEIVARSYARMV
jgi:hypothetical protein